MQTSAIKRKTHEKKDNKIHIHYQKLTKIHTHTYITKT